MIIKYCHRFINISLLHAAQDHGRQNLFHSFSGIGYPKVFKFSILNPLLNIDSGFNQEERAVSLTEQFWHTVSYSGKANYLRTYLAVYKRKANKRNAIYIQIIIIIIIYIRTEVLIFVRIIFQLFPPDFCSGLKVGIGVFVCIPPATIK